MILPSKHVRAERALIGVGAQVLETLREPMTVSRLWNEVRQRRSLASAHAPIDYSWFILALDLLFAMGALETKRGLLHKVSR